VRARCRASSGRRGVSTGRATRSRINSRLKFTAPACGNDRQKSEPPRMP
jgi:hypothetical protein